MDLNTNPLPEKVFLPLLLVYHLLFIGVFTIYIHQNGGDAMAYWLLEADRSQQAASWGQHWGTGTFFIQWLNYLPARILGLPFWLGNLLYGLVGLWGIYGLYRLAKSTFPTPQTAMEKSLFYGLFLLPNLHFWTSGVGKEALVFSALVGLMWSYQNLKRRWIYLFPALVLVFLVRPYVGVLAFFSLMAVGLVQAKIPVKYRLVLGGLGLLMGFLAWLYLKELLRLEDFSLNAYRTYMDWQMEFLRGFGAASEVPMESYPMPYQWITFLYRPFIWEAEDLWPVLAALENSLYLGLTLGLVGFIRWRGLKRMPAFLQLGLLLFVVLVFFLSQGINVLGIMMRLKNMVMVYFLLGLVFLFLSSAQSSEVKRGTFRD
ncbi:hypothetical protein [Pararhodonellum marinum]|uniref:hypothetical protein n=1 Tax=Pararhodonellum marinum TaxID=2755358 RepID=UPI00188DF46A|nr:hypothetical protein [Pararhodonellum marinum]